MTFLKSKFLRLLDELSSWDQCQNFGIEQEIQDLKSDLEYLLYFSHNFEVKLKLTINFLTILVFFVSKIIRALVYSASQVPLRG